MSRKLQVTLPVMLHFEKEIETFLEAKKRLEAIGDRTGVPLEVGAFLPFMPNHSRKPESFDKQLENQKKYHLPIRLVETGVYHKNALSYAEDNPTYDFTKPSDLERTIMHVAKLRDLDLTAYGKLVVAPHMGILVIDSIKEGDFSNPSIFSFRDFMCNKEFLYQKSKAEFTRLSNIASALRLKLAIEPAHLACVENVFHYQDKKGSHEMVHQVFNDLTSLLDISRGHLVLDANHLAVNRNVPARFKMNGYDPAALFATMGISSWDEYIKRVGEVKDYLPHAHGVHISSVDGIGVRLKPGTENGRLWGDGTGPDTTRTADYNLMLRTAQERGLPVAIEQEYELKPLTYREADLFLEPVLTAYAESQKD